MDVLIQPMGFREHEIIFEWWIKALLIVCKVFSTLQDCTEEWMNKWRRHSTGWKNRWSNELEMGGLGGVQTCFLAAVLWLAVSSDLVVTGDLYCPRTVKDQDRASINISSGFTFTAFEHFLGSSKDLQVQHENKQRYLKVTRRNCSRWVKLLVLLWKAEWKRKSRRSWKTDVNSCFEGEMFASVSKRVFPPDMVD